MSYDIHADATVEDTGGKSIAEDLQASIPILQT